MFGKIRNYFNRKTNVGKSSEDKGLKLDSEECRIALNNYEAKNDLEEMAVSVLLSKPEDVINVQGLCDLPNDEMDQLAEIIKAIRNDIGITEED